MRYKDSITKPRYKNSVDIELENIFDFRLHTGNNNKARTWQDIEEQIFDYSPGMEIYEMKEDDIMDWEEMLGTARCYIKNKTGIGKWSEGVDEDIKLMLRQSMAQSIDDTYLLASIEIVISDIEEEINSAVGEVFPDSKYQLLWYSEEDETLHKEMKYNTSQCKVFLPQKTILNVGKKIVGEDEDNIQEICYFLEEELMAYISKLDWDRIDNHARGESNMDDWFKTFKEFEDVTTRINNRIRKHQKRVKAFIRNNLQLGKREPLAI